MGRDVQILVHHIEAVPSNKNQVELNIFNSEWYINKLGKDQLEMKIITNKHYIRIMQCCLRVPHLQLFNMFVKEW